jgi:hypothetical protein
MRSALLAFYVLVFAATAGLAQTTSAAPPAPTAIQGPPPSVVAGELAARQKEIVSAYLLATSCPVGIKAQQEGSAQREWTISLEDAGQAARESESRSSGVHVELNAPKDKTLSQVELAVYFKAPVSGVLPVAGASSAPDQKKTFDLSAGDDPARTLSGSLLVGPAAGVTRVHLLSITYSDGTEWRATSGTNCNAYVSHFVLVGGH